VAQDIESKAVELIPKRFNSFLEKAGSLRSRYNLFQRDMQFIGSDIDLREILKVSLVRFFASELSREAGIKNFGKESEYHKIKLRVRKAVVEYIQGHPEASAAFEKTVSRREKHFFLGYRELSENLKQEE